MTTKTYKNRYGDEIIFNQINDKEIIMSGGKYIRFAYKNDYMLSYTTYLKNNNDKLSLDEFINVLHSYDNEISDYTHSNLEQYRKMVTSTSEIDMVDPSGGPYLVTGMNMDIFGLSGLIRWFEFIEDSKIRIYVS